MKLIIYLFFISFVISCSEQKMNPLKNKEYHSDGLDSVFIKTFSVTKELEIMSSDLKSYKIGMLAVDGKSRLYISSGNNIELYDSNGIYLHTFGRRGRGPGEFSNMQELKPILSKTRLFAYDDVLKRINAYSIEQNEFLFSIPIRPDNWKNIEELKEAVFEQFYVVDDSTLLVEFKDYYLNDSDEPLQSRFYYMDVNGEIISDQIMEIPKIEFFNGQGIPKPVSGTLNAPFPNASTQHFIIDIDSKSNIYSAWTGNFSIKVYSCTGKYKHSITHEFEKKNLDKQQIIDSYKSRGDRIYQKAKQYSYPDTWPAIDQLLIDDKDRIWVSTIVDDDSYYEWYILDTTGEILTRFMWSGERFKRHYQQREIKYVNNNSLFTIEVDDETGEKKVVKYKFTLD